jgi:hypothetical protein
MVDKSTLDSCLSGIIFPADGNVIVDCSSGNHCPPEVIAQVESLPSRTYGSEDELLCRLGNTEYCHLAT